MGPDIQKPAQSEGLPAARCKRTGADSVGTLIVGSINYAAICDDWEA